MGLQFASLPPPLSSLPPPRPALFRSSSSASARRSAGFGAPSKAASGGGPATAPGGGGSACLDDKSLADLRVRRRDLTNAVSGLYLDLYEAKLRLRVQVGLVGACGVGRLM